MRKTQSTIALRCMDPELCYKLLSTLNQYEGVTAIFEGGCSKERISEVHRNNKTVAFSSPYRVMENLNEGIIVINAFEGSCPTKVQDYFENIVLIGPGHPTLECQIKAIADKYDLDLGDFIPQEENGLVATATANRTAFCATSIRQTNRHVSTWRKTISFALIPPS